LVVPPEATKQGTVMDWNRPLNWRSREPTAAAYADELGTKMRSFNLLSSFFNFSYIFKTEASILTWPFINLALNFFKHLHSPKQACLSFAHYWDMQLPPISQNIQLNVWYYYHYGWIIQMGKIHVLWDQFYSWDI